MNGDTTHWQKTLFREKNGRMLSKIFQSDKVCPPTFSIFLSCCARRKKVVCVLKSYTVRPEVSVPGSPVPNERAPLTEHAMRLPHSSPTLQRGEILIEWKDGTVTPLYEAWKWYCLSEHANRLGFLRSRMHVISWKTLKASLLWAEKKNNLCWHQKVLNKLLLVYTGVFHKMFMANYQTVLVWLSCQKKIKSCLKLPE